MKLAVSNIAWAREEDQSCYDLLRDEGIGYLEIAPSRIWDAPAETSEADWNAARAGLRESGLSVVAMQALLFNRSELQIFQSDAERDATREYLSHLYRMAAALGAESLVFGSPQNRTRGDVTPDRARAIAVEFFRSTAEEAARCNVVLCLEPNPAQYKCDFINYVEEAAGLIREVDSKGFRLNLDASSMILNEEDIEQSVAGAADCIQHVHVSEPYLAGVGSHVVEHRRIAAALRQSGYQNSISIEMRRAQDGTAQDAVRRAIQLTREIYFT